MSSLVATSPASLESHPELAQNVVHTLRNSGFDHIIPKLDPFHPDFSDSDRYEILKERYEKRLIADGLETGHFVLNDKGEFAVAISQPLPSVAGFIFEAFTVRTFNEKKNSVGKEAFQWSTERSKVKAGFLKQFHAVGIGFPSTRDSLPQLYNPTLYQFDVIFHRLNPQQ